MSRGRQKGAHSDYRMHIHKSRGHEYVSTRFTPEGKKYSAYRHWGTLEKGVFKPFTEFLTLPVEEQDKYIFMEGWDLSELRALQARCEGARKHAGGQEDAPSVSLQYGAVSFLDRISEKIGLREDLLRAFDGDVEKVDELISLAYYTVIYPEAYADMEDFQRVCRFPTQSVMSPSVISRLTSSVTEDQKTRFLQSRIRRFEGEEDDSYCIDSTSAYGNNKYGPLRQTDLVVVYGLKCHQPLYFEELPSNGPDCRSTRDLIPTLGEHKFGESPIVYDMGHYSRAGMEKMIAEGLKFIMAVPPTSGDAYKEIKALTIPSDGSVPEGMEVSVAMKMYVMQRRIDFQVTPKEGNPVEADRLMLNIYYDPVRRARERVELEVSRKSQQLRLDDCVERETVIKKEDRRAFESKYPDYGISYDKDSHVTSYESNGREVSPTWTSMGFAANFTHGLDLTPEQAMERCSMRDEQEKVFEMQGILDVEGYRTHADLTTAGRQLVYLLALSLMCKIRGGMGANNPVNQTVQVERFGGKKENPARTISGGVLSPRGSS